MNDTTRQPTVADALSRTIKHLDDSVGSMIPNQVTDRSRPDYGGWLSPELGFASPFHIGNAHFVASLGQAYATGGSAYCGSPEVLERLTLAIDFQKSCTRSSGFTDLPFTNFDSPTDTAFALAAIGRALWMARANPDVDSAPLDDALESYLVPSARAVSEGGFHTPNHRWVVVAALSQVAELFPSLDVAAAIDSYLAEGIDVNEDGQYSERSNGGYNAVCNTHLLQAYEVLGRDEILQAVRKNLNYMLSMFHDDYSVVTSISLRQDKGCRVVPAGQANAFLYLGLADANPTFVRTAFDLLDRGHDTGILHWLARHPEWMDADVEVGDRADRYTVHLPASGIWRSRRGALSATLATGVSGVLSVEYGGAHLRAVRLHSSYFAGARFTGRELRVDGDTATVTLRSEFLLPQLPGYWKPLGEPVPYEDLPFNNLEKRELIPRPEFVFTLSVREVDDGFDLRVRTEGGMEHVPFVLSFLFDVPGHIELENATFPAASDNALILRSGHLTYRAGDDAITIGPGFYGHRLADTAGTEPFDGAQCVAMTDWTQVDRTIHVRCGRWSEAEGPCFSGDGPVALGGA